MVKIQCGDIFIDYRIGHVHDVLRDMESGSVNMAVTSPPYFGLRDYGCPPAVWDGVDGCSHVWGNEITRKQTGGTEKSISYQEHQMYESSSQFCQKCGAWKGQLGLEPDFNLYIKHLCDIFDEVKRVLRDDGTCWVNLGDTYWGGKGSHGTTKQHNKERHKDGVTLQNEQHSINMVTRPQDVSGIYPSKSLVMIPFRFGIEMVNRGWVLRNTLIWHKPSCMPSSAKDRFTVDFEHLFFFSKSRKYYFEQQIEPCVDYEIKRRSREERQGLDSTYNLKCEGQIQAPSKSSGCRSSKKKVEYAKQGRNKRCVWSICSKPYPEAHFAVFPAELIEIPIKAGCPLHGVVLDPFVGSGTTLEECKRLNRSSIGIDIQDNYKELIEKRLNISKSKSGKSYIRETKKLC